MPDATDKKPDENPVVVSKKVDEDWKAQVQRERAAMNAELRKDETRADEEADATYFQFVQGLVAEAQIYLGVIEHPMTGRREANLEQAKYLIDVLRALDRKTRKTQTPTEQQFFRRVLSELQMLFVKISQHARTQGAGGGMSGRDRDEPTSPSSSLLGGAPNKGPAPKGRR